MVVQEYEGKNRTSPKSPPQAKQASVMAKTVHEVAKNNSANEGHDLHKSAKSETGRERFSPLDHHRRDPSGQAENAEQAEEGGCPDCNGGPPVTRLQQFEDQVSRRLVVVGRNGRRCINVGALRP